MRHLITGGGGFIGSHLSDALIARGDPIVVAGWTQSRTLHETIRDVVVWEHNEPRTTERAALAV